jgi:hypothetical protein
MSLIVRPVAFFLDERDLWQVRLIIINGPAAKLADR